MNPIFKDFYITFSLKSFLKGHIWTRKVSFWGKTYLYLLNNRIFVERSFEKSIAHKSFKTNVRIHTNFNEWKQYVFLSIRHVWIHSSSRIWMLQPQGIKQIKTFLVDVDVLCGMKNFNFLILKFFKLPKVLKRKTWNGINCTQGLVKK